MFSYFLSVSNIPFHILSFVRVAVSGLSSSCTLTIPRPLPLRHVTSCPSDNESDTNKRQITPDHTGSITSRPRQDVSESPGNSCRITISRPRVEICVKTRRWFRLLPRSTFSSPTIISKDGSPCGFLMKKKWLQSLQLNISVVSLQKATFFSP